MTILKGTVTRETDVKYKGRHIIVSLEAPDTIVFREKGRRESFTLPIFAAYEMAMKIAARDKLKEKGIKV